jgi:hypothetical protein
MARETQQDILELAVEAFKKNVRPDVKVETVEHDRRVDRPLRMGIDGKVLRFHAEVKAVITKAGAALLLAYQEKIRRPVLLVTRYVNPRMADMLKTEGLEFIDAAGNAFINQPPFYVFVKGNKPPEIARPVPYARTFKATGLKIVYAFLCNPGLVNKPYRQIADAAGAALGTVGWLIQELKYQGYLLDTGKRGMKMLQKEDLLRRWVDAYPETLRPKLILGRFRGDEGGWRTPVLKPDTALWGGEVAATELTGYLKPQVITLYVNRQMLNRLLLDNRLRKDPTGDVEILERFWGPGEAFQRKALVHPVLVYADLMAVGNQRDRETAKMIYDQHIARLVREG